jgi:ABC-type dipeptide/oligopeptide/nickel transport system ATPase component
VPTGCAFRDRCLSASDVCRKMPSMEAIGNPAGGQTVRCFHPLRVVRPA